ncbi:MAG TPA: alkaline phosphatase family protein [Actinomycetota bacterium]
MSEWRDMQQELAARRVERRSFLKGAAALSTLAMLETNSIAKALVGRYGPPEARAIDTIVVTLMENRSTDHFLGWMGSVIDGVQEGFWNPARLEAAGSACSSDPAHQFPIADATPVPTYRLPGHCLGSDPDHGWTGSRIEFNGGAMNGFAHRSGADAMGYYLEDDVPLLGWLAKNYTTFSRYFSSVMGPTYPNRLYWLAGQGGGYKGNTIPGPQVAGRTPAGFTDGDPEPDGHDWSSVFHQLDYFGIPWTYYHHDLASVMLFFNRVEENPGKVRFIGDYYADAAAGILTPVVFLDPGFVTVGNDDHPARDIAFGQRYLYDTFMALAQSRHWYSPRTGKGSVYVVSYDEGGGFYDHVPPPRVTDRNRSDDHCEDWGRLGFRVPTVVASPFSRGPDNGGGPTGVVNQSLFDHTSILKFIQWRFGLGSLNDRAYPGTLGFENGLNLGSRDDAPEIGNLASVLDFANPRPDLPSEPPQIPLHPEGIYCSPAQFPEETGGENPLEPVPEIPLPPLARPRIPEPVVPHAEWVALADRGFFGKYDYRERAKHGVFRD